MRNDPLKEIEKRTQRYWYEDGIWELGSTVIYFLLGIFYLVIANAAQGSWLRNFITLLQMAVILSAYFLMMAITRTLKARITYPRTGYVAYRRRNRQSRVRRALLGGLLAGVIGALVGAVALIPEAQTKIPLIISIVMAAMLLVVGIHYELPRMLVNAVLTILLGFGLGFFTDDAELGTGIFFIGFGLISLISGLITLRSYLRNTVPASADDDYEPPQTEARHE